MLVSHDFFCKILRMTLEFFFSFFELGQISD